MPNKNSSAIIKSLEILKIENSEVKIQNSSILASGKLTPKINNEISNKVKDNQNNYDSVD